jgi:type IV secretion system protein VirB2
MGIKVKSDACYIGLKMLLASLLFRPAAASAQGTDPAGSGPVNAALLWLQGTLLGTVATTVAVMAVAAIGFMMLTGRMNWRFGATVIIGVFILFGATTIVAGIQSAAGGKGSGASPATISFKATDWHGIEYFAASIAANSDLPPANHQALRAGRNSDQMNEVDNAAVIRSMELDGLV